MSLAIKAVEETMVHMDHAIAELSAVHMYFTDIEVANCAEEILNAIAIVEKNRHRLNNTLHVVNSRR